MDEDHSNIAFDHILRQFQHRPGSSKLPRSRNRPSDPLPAWNNLGSAGKILRRSRIRLI